MNRRTLLKLIASAGAAIPFRGIRIRAQSVLFATDHAPVVKAIAAAVLPESLGRPGTDAAAERFLRWLGDYHAGVDMDHGYGVTRLQKTPPLPFERYAQQCDALEQAAQAAGGSSFGALPVADRRALVRRALTDAKIEAMPIRPNGQHIAADLMTSYFRSSEANDLCYRAHVARYACRGLANAPKAPAPLDGGR